MKRLHVFRWHGIEVVVRAFGRYWFFAYTTSGLFGNGHRWILLGPTRCLCTWYGPDLGDGCSECGR